MKKNIGFVIVSLLLISCGGDKQVVPVLPTIKDVSGYWKLDKMLKNGVSVSFDQNPNTLATNLQNQYAVFNDSNNSFEMILEIPITVIIYKGSWELNQSTFTTKYAGGGSAIYDVKSFTANELVLVDQRNREFDLSFKRLLVDDYPETVLTANVNGQGFVGNGNQAYRSTSSLALTGENLAGEWINLTINNPDALVAGQSFALGLGNGIYRATPNGTLLGSIDGNITINKISSTYISLSFQFNAKTQSSAQVSITNGTFKAIIKRI